MTEEHNAPEFVWLEDVESERALAWVREQNERTHEALRHTDPSYTSKVDTAVELLNARDRIPMTTLRGDHVYSFWQDEEHTRGLWRRMRFEDYVGGSEEWDVLLDVDALATEEDKNWVFAFAQGLAPDYERFMIWLSPGGSDASVKREFDIPTRRFVEDGFFVPESKTHTGWIDRDTLLVGSAYDPTQLTTSGYARQLRVWHRGTPIEEATPVFEIGAGEVGVYIFIQRNETGRYILLLRRVDFYHGELHLLLDDLSTTVKLPLPERFGWSLDVFRHYLTFVPNQDWEVQPGTVLQSGALVALDLEPYLSNGSPEHPPVQSLFTPDERMALGEIRTTRDGLLISYLEEVRARMAFLRPDADGVWTRHAVELPHDLGTAMVQSASSSRSEAIIRYEDLITPTALYLVSPSKLKATTPIRQRPARFDASNLTLTQRHATSTDGTRIPYFIVHPRDITLDGSHRALLYAYGGFNIARVPSYDPTLGRFWLEQGNVYVIANIRGGGEFGPKWHQSALKENRQRAFDDFHAVSEDIQNAGFTSPSRCAIRGGSNGGLLVGVAFTQRPELYGAVICQVPLLDMMRFHHLHAGASWIAEYGNPDIPEERAWIARYSPYQALRADATYPRVFFMTSTKDDRVHPSHARRMVAKMLELGHEVFYYENIDGGHAGVANNIQAAESLAMRFQYLEQELS